MAYNLIQVESLVNAIVIPIYLFYLKTSSICYVCARARTYALHIRIGWLSGVFNFMCCMWRLLVWIIIGFRFLKQMLPLNVKKTSKYKHKQ